MRYMNCAYIYLRSLISHIHFRKMFDWIFDLSDADKVYYLSIGMILNAVFVAPILTYLLPAYYGRYTGKYTMAIPANISWILQESPAFLIPAFCCMGGEVSHVNQILLGMLCLHYFQRSFIYPMLLRTKNPVPISITFFALLFCTYNGYLQGLSLSTGPQYAPSTLNSPHFIIGSILFLAGMAGNMHSDSILRNLRKPGESGYKIPFGGMFNYVSAANYFCETIEWTGFAIACWNLSSGAPIFSVPSFANDTFLVAFVIYTVSNLFPRALSHHEWYHQKFENYPKTRKAFIPYLI